MNGTQEEWRPVEGCGLDMESYALGYNEGYADSVFHRLSDVTLDDDALAHAIEVGRCTLPPSGWWCSLPEGHDGPCPTRRLPKETP